MTSTIHTYRSWRRNRRRAPRTGSTWRQASGWRVGDRQRRSHLHLGLLLDNQVEQDSWTFILREGDIRKTMGSYKNGELLPPE